MSYFLFVLFIILCCWLITRISFFSNSGPSHRCLISLFLIRVAISMVGCYLAINYFPVSDSLAFQNMADQEYQLLFHQPTEYFTNLFHSNYSNNYSRLLEVNQSYWNDLRSNLIIKLISILNIFSGSNFYINTLLFNFLVFFGSTALYKVFIKEFPKAGNLLIFCVFLLPSSLFFSAAIHRDGLILLVLSMAVYQFYFLLKEFFSIKRAAWFFTFLLLIFLLRSFVFITLVPALIAWSIAHQKPKFTFFSFLVVYVFSAILFFSSSFISKKIDFPNYVAERQQEFMLLSKEANSTIKTHVLQPNLKSFIHNTPQAFNHSLLRPYLTEISNLTYVPFSLEIFLLEVLFIFFIFFKKKNICVPPLIYFGVFFSISILLVIGYTIPILGALVRYRSIYLMFLFIPLLLYIDWKKIGSVFKLNFKKYN